MREGEESGRPAVDTSYESPFQPKETEEGFFAGGDSSRHVLMQGVPFSSPLQIVRRWKDERERQIRVLSTDERGTGKREGKMEDVEIRIEPEKRKVHPGTNGEKARAREDALIYTKLYAWKEDGRRKVFVRFVGKENTEWGDQDEIKMAIDG